MFRRPRWSDGRIVSYRQDQLAFGLHLWSLASGITVTIMWIFYSRWAAWWVLIPVSAAINLALEHLARTRLRRAAMRVEALNGAEQAAVAEHAPVEIGLEDWFNFKLKRFDGYMIRGCDRTAQKLLVRAETAEANGNQKSAAKYRRRAERQRDWGERWRRATGYDDHQS